MLKERSALPFARKEEPLPSLCPGRRLQGLAVLALSLTAMLAVPAAATAAVGRVGSAPRPATVVRSTVTADAVGGGGTGSDSVGGGGSGDN